MIKQMKYLLTLFILSILLVACGTSNETNTAGIANEQTEDFEDQTNDETAETEEELTNEGETEATTENDKSPIDENNTPNQIDNDNNEEKSPATEIQISYQMNKESVVETAPWIQSDNQNFGLYVLPAYELSAEEPMNDVIYFKEDELHMMRISILPSNSDLEALKENTIAQLEASLNEKVETVSPPADFSKTATVMQTRNEEELVTAYLIQDQNHIIKLTIFTKNQDNHLDAFVQMAKHIKVN